MQPIFIEKFFPEQILNLSYSYCLIKYSNRNNFNYKDTQAHSLVAENSDFLMETLLDLSTSVIEKNVGKKLWPTYSYLRIYDRESDLPAHKDKKSCEYTVAICLGADPIDKPYEIFVGEKDSTSDYKYYTKEKSYERLKIDYKFPMLPNNALIFKGRDNLHWREFCQHDHCIMVFLHYVDQEGPYKEFKFDNRPSLGVL